MGDAHSPISPKRSPTTIQVSSAGALTTSSARIFMPRSSLPARACAIPAQGSAHPRIPPLRLTEAEALDKLNL